MFKLTLVSKSIGKDYLEAKFLETYHVEISNSLHKSVKSAASNCFKTILWQGLGRTW